jgi:hypothetical protein
VSVTGFLPHSGHKIFDEITENCDAVIEQRTLIHHTNLWVSGDYESVQEIAVLFIHPFLSKLEEKAVAMTVTERSTRPPSTSSSSFSLPEKPSQYSSEASIIEKMFTSSDPLVKSVPETSVRPHQSLNQPYSYGRDDEMTTAELYSQYLPSGYKEEEDSHQIDDLYSAYLDSYHGVGAGEEPLNSHSRSHFPPPLAPNSFSPEQHQLQDDLTNGVYSSNIKLTVTTLRKMYTKQTKTFRIPLVLAVVLPDTSAMIINGRNDLVNIAICFILDCIQWCFGVQKGENFESFKYKMNANIARWLLKECVRKGIPTTVSSVVSNATVKLMSQILENYLELTFVYELLQSLNIPQPIQRMVPYIHHWLNLTATLPGSMHTRVHEFLYAHPEFSPALSTASPLSFSSQQTLLAASLHPGQQQPLCRPDPHPETPSAS